MNDADRMFSDVFGHEIALAASVRAMILKKHPETADFIDDIDLVLKEPAEIRQSVRDERSVLYYRYDPTILNGKWVVVVVKRVDRHFVSTVYATDQIKSGERLWPPAT